LVTLRLLENEPLTQALVDAIHAGEVDWVRELVTENQDLASARMVNHKGGSGTALHTATGWPGYFPNGPQIVSILIGAGADPNGAVEGSWHAETPLHWAASSDDVEVARALIDGGANVEATGASLGGGTPLDNAVGYGCWQVARLLVERGARVDMGQAAALGLMTRVRELVAADPPTPEELADAFWGACHGGQRRMAEFLVDLGADVNATPSWGDSTPLDAADSLDTGREALVTWLRQRGASKSTDAGTESSQGRGRVLPPTRR
jgi:ankyrin repeat protein